MMSMNKLRTLTLLFVILIATFGCRPTAPAITAPAPEPSWDQAFSRSSGWNGGDVAASIQIPGNRVLWLFGDSFIGAAPGGRRVDPTLVNNAIGVHPFNPADPARPPAPDQLAFYWGPPDRAGKPTAWVRPPRPTGRAAETWYWPTGGAVVSPGPEHPRLAVFLIRLQKKIGADGVWGFDCIGSAMAVIDAADAPAETWRPRVLALPHDLRRPGSPGEEIDWGVAARYEPEASAAGATPPAAAPAAGETGWVYIYGARSDPDQRRDLLLARVRPADLDDFADWEFWAAGKWAAKPDQATPVVTDVASELSVDRVEAKGGTGGGNGAYYLMVSSESFLGDHILARTALRLTGPWSAPQEVFQIPGVGGNRFAYAAKGHLALSPPGAVLCSYIVNSNDLADLQNPDLYRPRFILIPLPVPAP